MRIFWGLGGNFRRSYNIQVSLCLGLFWDSMSRIRGVLNLVHILFTLKKRYNIGFKGLCQPGFLQCNVVIISPGLGDNYMSATDMHTRVLTGLRRLIRDSQSGDSIQVT